MRYKIKYESVTPNLPKLTIYKENCYVGISINNDFFWGEHTDIFFKWIAKRFKNCKIIVGDYIHRHNEVIFNNSTSQESERRSLYLGDRMLELLNEEQELKGGKFEIFRWNDIYSLPEVKTYELNIIEHYKSNVEFKFLIDSSAKEFISRQVKNNKIPEVNYTICIKHSIDYIIEELAVFCYFINNGNKVQIYPGTQLSILKHLALKEVSIKTILSEGIYIDLKTVKIKK